MKVFLVEDSIMIRQRLERILSRVVGLEIVGGAGQPDAALEAILRLRPNIVLLDIQLLGGEGLQVLQGIKNQVPRPIVIVLTNYPSPEFRNKYLHSGADYFLDKSTEFHKLAPLCTELMKRRPTSDEAPKAPAG